MEMYHGDEPGKVPGLLPNSNKAPNGYFWWEGGALMETMIHHYARTDEDRYNSQVMEAMKFQVGENDNYEPTNQTSTLANDDQAIWALAALSAAETKFPNSGKGPAWLGLAEAVFNSQVPRWDSKTCSGGLRWSIFPFNRGYNYKSAFANGIFFQLAARLARDTKNQTYTEWAEKAFDWTMKSGIIDEDYNVFDGASVGSDCETVNRLQWSYNSATFLYGCATMHMVTGDAKWKKHTNGFLDGMSLFFKGDDGVLTEEMCEEKGNCNTDQLAFKSMTTRWMTGAAQVAPFIFDRVEKHLKQSAKGAAKACRGNKCGFKWTESFDGKTGIGQQMNALELMGDLIELKSRSTTKATGSLSSNSTRTDSSMGSSTASFSTASGSGDQDPQIGGQSRTFGVSFSSLAVGLVASWIILV
ncbi:MAG: hydrolase 76 protein [Alyxoria varia]|nr:MAG: hydrolase 76 protein [Alyxoria varia]